MVVAVEHTRPGWKVIKGGGKQSEYQPPAERRKGWTVIEGGKPANPREYQPSATREEAIGKLRTIIQDSDKPLTNDDFFRSFADIATLWEKNPSARKGLHRAEFEHGDHYKLFFTFSSKGGIQQSSITYELPKYRYKNGGAITEEPILDSLEFANRDGVVTGVLHTLNNDQRSSLDPNDYRKTFSDILNLIDDRALPGRGIPDTTPS